MALVRPFRAVRPRGELAPQVLAPPYDVIDRAEAKRIAGGNPHSFLHITRAEADLPDAVASHDEAVYLKSRENLNAFLNAGVLARDEKPGYGLYRQTMDGNTQTGVVACVSADEYESGAIKRHELTRTEKEADRVRHFDVCDANTEPVFLMYRENARVKDLTARAFDAGTPAFDFVSEDGVGHALRTVSDPATAAAIETAFREVPALYIADGHHRSASAYRVCARRRAAGDGRHGEEEFNFFMAVIFPSDELRIMDYNRTVRDLNGHTKESFLAAVAERFEVTPRSEALRPDAPGNFGMCLDGAWYALRARPDRIPAEDVIGALDVSILQNELLAPILGIADPRTDERIDFVGGIRGLGELERRVRADMAVAFSLCPVSTETLMDVADRGLVMPPKSTWFEPKLGSGLFLHELKDA